MKAIAPFIGQQVIGSPSQLTTLAFPADRFTGQDLRPGARRLRGRAQGAGAVRERRRRTGVDPGLPQQAFAKDVTTYPLQGTVASRWYLGPDGSLEPDAPTAADDAAGTIDSYVSDPSRPAPHVDHRRRRLGPVPALRLGRPGRREVAHLPLAGARHRTPPWSGPAASTCGSARRHADTDLQVTLTEVRPDGKETYVQSGWLRTQRPQARRSPVHRAPAAAHDARGRRRAAARRRVHPGARRDLPVRPRVPGRQQGPADHHRARWRPHLLGLRHAAGTPTNEIARSVGRPSSIALPRGPERLGADRPSGLPGPARPAVPHLRGAHPACFLIISASTAPPFLTRR